MTKAAAASTIWTSRNATSAMSIRLVALRRISASAGERRERRRAENQRQQRQPAAQGLACQRQQHIVPGAPGPGGQRHEERFKQTADPRQQPEERDNDRQPVDPVEREERRFDPGEPAGFAKQERACERESVNPQKQSRAAVESR